MSTISLDSSILGRGSTSFQVRQSGLNDAALPGSVFAQTLLLAHEMASKAPAYFSLTSDDGSDVFSEIELDCNLDPNVSMLEVTTEKEIDAAKAIQDRQQAIRNMEKKLKGYERRIEYLQAELNDGCLTPDEVNRVEESKCNSFKSKHVLLKHIYIYMSHLW